MFSIFFRAIELLEKKESYVAGDVGTHLGDVLSAHPAAKTTVVLDPPAFAKSRSAVEGAARGYKEINLRALRLLEPGGVLVTCSCSHHMSESALLDVLASAALDAGRNLNPYIDGRADQSLRRTAGAGSGDLL